ncbi:MAG: hypothetical protein M1821_000551 [Bathelium mastoideum]|nr:MAG: hypothetical protein M1821_000551 [Bathelium mastoideum]
MLPLDALGVAAATVQFVDFSIEIASKANEIRKNGISDSERYFRDSSVRLISLNAGLRKRKQSTARTDGHVAWYEAVGLYPGHMMIWNLILAKGLNRVLNECCVVADELIGIFARHTALTPGRVRSLLSAFLSHFSEEKTKTLCERLDRLRSELSIYILTLINEKLETQHDDISARLNRLENATYESTQAGQKKIVEVVTFSQHSEDRALSRSERLNASESQVLRSYVTDLDRKEGRTEYPIDIRDEEAIVAIIRFTDGSFRELVAQAGQSPVLRGMSAMRSESIDVTTVFRGNAQAIVKDQAVATQFAPMAQTVLNSLYFQAYRDREESIATAHSTTFQWILEGNGEFINFLRSSDNAFWVTGKAGSGKSTLMKYVRSNFRTMNALEQWAGEAPLVVGSYYFWSAGTQLQKSQEGLFRSILHTVVENNRHLIPVGFPEACQEYLDSGFTRAPKVAISDCARALKRIMTSPLMKAKVCLFVDGLDEYEGDLEDLVTLLDNIMLLPGLKLIMSSRPLNIFTDYFQQYPRIMMQDLTRNDIYLYTKSHLRSSRMGGLLMERDPVLSESLVLEITNKSSGVFLWVALVVRSLLYGLTSGDTVETLRERLEVLPPELERLYTHMFSSMEPLYRDDLARMCLLMEKSVEIQIHGPMSLFQLRYALEESLRQALRAPISLPTPAARREMYDVMNRRLNSRTHGLIEVVKKPTDNFAGSSSIDMPVAFLHKTVLDFLKTAEIRDQLIGRSAKLDATVALLASCLLEMKSVPSQRAVILSSDRVFVDLYNGLELARHLEAKQKRPQASAIDELKAMASYHWKEAKEWKDKANSTEWKSSKGTDWASAILHYLYPTTLDGFVMKSYGLDPFMTLMILSGCVLYVADKMFATDIAVFERSVILAEMVWQLLRPAKDETRTDGDTRRFNLLTAIRQLIEQGANPNTVLVMATLETIVYETRIRSKRARLLPDPSAKLGASIWQYVLYYVKCDEIGWVLSAQRAVQVLQLLQILISSGADLHTNNEGDISVDEAIYFLTLALFDPSRRVFLIDVDGKEQAQVCAEFSKTMEILDRRKAGRMVLSKPKDAFSALAQFWHSSFAQSFMSFTLGGILVLLCARWLNM